MIWMHTSISRARGAARESSRGRIVRAVRVGREIESYQHEGRPGPPRRRRPGGRNGRARRRPAEPR